jgi:hypothetical protein
VRVEAIGKVKAEAEAKAKVEKAGGRPAMA